MKERFEKKNRYAIKKKKGGGGAASMLIGSILLGSMIVSSSLILADDSSSDISVSNTQPTTSSDQNANEKFEITDLTLSKNVVKESEGFDIDINIEWDGTNLRKGDVLELDLPREFDSIEKVVTQKVKDSKLGDFGLLTLDYINHKIRFEITYDVNYFRPYYGTLTIGTYVNRNFYTEFNNPSKPVVFNTPTGTFKPELSVIWDTMKSDQDQMMTLITNTEFSTSPKTVSWMTAIRTDRIEGGLHDPVIYLLNKDDVNDIKFGKDSHNDPVIDKLVTAPITTDYNLDLSSVKVYEANIKDSFAYEKGKELKRGESTDEGIDYFIAKSQVAPDAKEIWAIVFVGDYANTDKQLVVEYSGTIPEGHTELQTAALLTTYTTVYNDETENHLNGQLTPIYSGANVFATDSEAVMKVDETKGTVIVSHVDKETGKVLKYECVAKNEPVNSLYHTEPKTFEGYNFVERDENSAPADGKVLSGVQVVVYYYSPEKQKSNVDVTYKTVNGEVLGKTEDVFTEDKEVGTAYRTVKKEFPGYHFVDLAEDSAPAEGSVTESKQHVIYLYAKDETPEAKKGNVDVTYVAEDGTVLAPTADVVKDGEVGSTYTTEEKSFEGYTFQRMGAFSADRNGEVEEGTKHVVYVYAKNQVKPVEKKGSVDVAYVTTDGTPLEEVTMVKDNVPVGEDYTTEEKTFTGYHFVGMDKQSNPAIGLVSEGMKHVIYVYAKDETPEVKKGNVDVTYVAEDGTVLAPTADVVKDGEVGSTYTTEEKSFEGYTFQRMGAFSADRNGEVEEGTKHVVYVYAKNQVKPVEKKGSVDVAYVTTDGTPLEEVTMVKDNVPVGEDYTTEEKTFTGYHFVGMDKQSNPAIGLVSEGMKHVIYVYAKDETPEVKKGNVDVTYVAEDGTVLAPTADVVKDGEVGSTYTTEEKSFEGYTFQRMGAFSADRNGEVEEGTKHVVYVYAKNQVKPVEKKGSVDVAYVTTDGTPLEEVTMVKDNVPVGEDYTTEEKTFTGYHFVGMDKQSNPAIGLVSEGMKHVIYVYAKDETPEVKKGNVDVTYVAEDGTVLAPTADVVKDGEVGSTYTTEEKSFEGYTFQRMGAFSADRNGEVEEGTKHVVYVYAKNQVKPVEKKGSVDVKYITKDGKVLKDTTTVKDNVPVGEAYATEEKSFDGYHFVGMAKESDPATGVVAEGDKHVIYVYEKVSDKETPVDKKGTVTVVYVDKYGNPLPGGEKLTVKENVPVGEDYSTEQKKFDGYHFVGMGKNSNPVSGKVSEGTNEVVYVYEKDMTTTSNTPKLKEDNRPYQETPSSERVVSQSSAPTSKAKGSLPKAGTTSQSGNTVLGLASLSFAGLLGLIIRRRRGENE